MRFEFREQRLVKMQACRRRGDGAPVARENGLVSLLIELVGGAVDIRGQGHLAPAIEEIERWRRQADLPEIVVSPEHLNGAPRRRNLQPIAYGLARAQLDERLALAYRPLEQDLDSPAGGLGAKDSRRDDARVVQHQ